MKSAVVSLSVLLIIALASAQASADNWGLDKSEISSGPDFAKSKAICRKLGDPAPPATDEPTPAQVKALKGCDSEKLYYGEGAAPDYVKARLCAFIEASGADDQVFGGSTILMQVYANGFGARRNLDLAMAYACQIDGAPAESNGRVLHIQALKTKPGPFDFCDDITSGLAEGYCQSRISDQQAVGREARLEAMRDRLSPAAQALFGPMKKAFDTFVNAHGDGEVDMSGTARAAEDIEEQDRVRDQFSKELDHLLAGHWPPATAADTKVADLQLNLTYHKALAWAAGKKNTTTVRAADIRTAQRAWLVYRDAFLRFAAAASPALSRDAVLTRLTKLRTGQLEEAVD